MKASQLLHHCCVWQFGIIKEYILTTQDELGTFPGNRGSCAVDTRHLEAKLKTCMPYTRDFLFPVVIIIEVHVFLNSTRRQEGSQKSYLSVDQSDMRDGLQ
jgi:hypothetical protein